VAKREILPLSGIETQSSSPQPTLTETRLNKTLKIRVAIRSQPPPKRR